MRGKSIQAILIVLSVTSMMLTVGASADASEPPALPPGAGISATQGYTRHEPGHWEQTGILYFGPLEAVRETGGVTVAAELTAEKSDIVYTFTDAAGAQSVYTVTPYWFEERYYADDSFSVGVNIVRTPDEDNAPGGVTASLAIADLAQGEGEYGFIPSIRSYFTTASGQELQRFNVHENMTFSSGSEGKYYINPYGILPAGEADGQKLYALLGVQDDLDRGTRVFIAYEYTWFAVPEDIEVPAEYGPIEYYDTPVSTAVRFPVLLLVSAAVLIGIVAVVVCRRR